MFIPSICIRCTAHSSVQSFLLFLKSQVFKTHKSDVYFIVINLINSTEYFALAHWCCAVSAVANIKFSSSRLRAFLQDRYGVSTLAREPPLPAAHQSRRQGFCSLIILEPQL